MSIGNLNVTLCADNTILYASGHNAKEACGYTQKGCKLLEESWSMLNNLSVNTSKTKYMAVMVDDEEMNDTMLCNKKLEYVCKYNYLGVIDAYKLCF